MPEKFRARGRQIIDASSRRQTLIQIRALSPASRASIIFAFSILGLRSQSLAPPQALCCRPLRGLESFTHEASPRRSNLPINAPPAQICAIGVICGCSLDRFAGPDEQSRHPFAFNASQMKCRSPVDPLTQVFFQRIHTHYENSPPFDTRTVVILNNHACHNTTGKEDESVWVRARTEALFS